MAGLRIVAIRLLADQPDRLADFLVAALGFERAAGGLLRLGREAVEIEAAAGAPYPADIAANDARFQHFAVIVSDIGAAYERLRTTGGWRAISTGGPQHLPQRAGGVRAFKFRSPEGHPLELLQFSADRMPGPWAGRDGLFLGIDHSAIAVADTRASVAFYERLGFSLATSQVNRGAEQARLDGIPDPIVEVTALNPPGGAPPHLELLCYRQPVTLVSEPAGAGEVAATRLVCQGLAEPLQDPDGHRLLPA